ncbi:unnamed protein product [Amoebophrya sp. A120]|nr:unnamed protein product [Amoebophrya sp. A120]|eukprot:GSA120T00003638001.1
MALAVSYFNDTPVYNLTAGRSTPQFIEEAAKNNKSLRYNEEFRNRVELLQDFEFPATSSRVKASRDGRYICATGGYPWEMRMFDTEDLGMKFCRRVDHEIVDFCFLSDDYRKLAFLQSDRTLEFHAQYGLHHKLRVPKFCRSLVYHPDSCVLFAAGDGDEVYRLDLEQGTFLTPLHSAKCDQVNQACLNPRMPLLACAGTATGDETTGLVEFWDLRDAGRAVSFLRQEDAGITAVDFAPSGMHFCFGDERGVVRVFDIRSAKPLSTRDHRNELPIKAVKYFDAGGITTESATSLLTGTTARASSSSSNIIASCDARCIKLWEYGSSNSSSSTSFDNSRSRSTADEQQSEIKNDSTQSNSRILAAIESPGGAVLNDISFYPSSSLLFAATDEQRVGCYFLPSLGAAPQWCSFLDHMTEELAETQRQHLYEDHTFLSKEQVHDLGAADLLGTKYLLPYQHGFLMDVRTFEKMKRIQQEERGGADLFDYEQKLEQSRKKQMEQNRPMRVPDAAKLAKTRVQANQKLFDKLQDRVDSRQTELRRKKDQVANAGKKLLEDDRFAKMFSNPDFEIEEAEIRQESGVAKDRAKKRKRIG